jgi:hypothetical protein
MPALEIAASADPNTAYVQLHHYPKQPLILSAAPSRRRRRGVEGPQHRPHHGIAGAFPGAHRTPVPHVCALVSAEVEPSRAPPGDPRRALLVRRSEPPQIAAQPAQFRTTTNSPFLSEAKDLLRPRPREATRPRTGCPWLWNSQVPDVYALERCRGAFPQRSSAPEGRLTVAQDEVLGQQQKKSAARKRSA